MAPPLSRPAMIGTPFPLGDPRLDTVRGPFLDALRERRDKDAAAWGHAVMVEAENNHLVNGHGLADIVDAGQAWIADEAARAALALLPQEIDLRELSKLHVDPPSEIVEGIPEGEVALLGGHGGTGKSLILLYLCVCIALGRPWYGMPTKRRRVLFVGCEDATRSKDGEKSGPLHWRLVCICRWLGIQIADLHGWLRIVDATHVDAELMSETHDGAVLTHLYEWLRQQMHDSQVLALDGASDLFGANENVRRHVRPFVRALRRLIPSDGAVILLAHVDKTTAKTGETSEGYSGNTAWNNSVRARWYLRREPESDELLLEVQKSNYARAGTCIRLRWNDSAHLFVADETDAAPTGPIARALTAADEAAAILHIIRTATEAGDPIPTSSTGERSSYKVATARGLPPAFAGKSGRAKFYRLLESLRASGRIGVDSLRKPNRHQIEVFCISATAPTAVDSAPTASESAPPTASVAPPTAG